MEKKPLVLPVDQNKIYKEAMRQKLDALMKANNMTQLQLIEKLKERGLDADQGSVSLYLSGRRSIPLSIIVHLCDIFQVSLAELVNENFNSPRQVGGSRPVPQVYSNDLLQLIPYLGDKFVVEPSDAHFSGYLQTYHVYLFPSQSDDTRIRSGTLQLQAKGSVCEAILEINTNKLRDGKPYIKAYRGCCIISTTMRAVMILLTDQEKGELSVLNLSTYPLDCRIACTLLNATGVEHPPTMQRLFLSRTKIDDAHLPLLQTHLFLNGTTIHLRKERLEALREMDSSYHSVVDELLRTNQPHCVYDLYEDDILSTARRCLSKDGIPLRNPEDPEVNQFLARLRTLSDYTRFNKASRQADHLARRFLRSLGYFHDHEYDN